MSVMDGGTKMNITKAHELLGHCNENMMQEAAKKNMGWILTGGLWSSVLLVWPVRQSKGMFQRKVSMLWRQKERIGTVKKPKDRPKVLKPNWRIMVKERTGMKFSNFFEMK
jgi:hypothetical protein